MDITQQPVSPAQAKSLIEGAKMLPPSGANSTYVNSTAVDFCSIVQKQAIAVKRQPVKHCNLISKVSNYDQIALTVNI